MRMAAYPRRENTLVGAQVVVQLNYAVLLRTIRPAVRHLVQPIPGYVVER